MKGDELFEDTNLLIEEEPVTYNDPLFPNKSKLIWKLDKNAENRHHWVQIRMCLGIIVIFLGVLLVMTVLQKQPNPLRITILVKNQEQVYNISLDDVSVTATTDKRSSTVPVPAVDISAAEVAMYLKSSMNYSVDPCEDFYMYSCGGWIAKQTEWDGQNTILSYDEIDKHNNIALIEILESLGESGYGAEGKLGNFYKSCLIKDTVDRSTKLTNDDSILNDDGFWESERIRSSNKEEQFNKARSPNSINSATKAQTTCVELAKTNFFDVLTRLYVQANFGKVAEVKKMFNQIRIQFQSRISKTSWIDDKAKDYFKFRLETLDMFPGFSAKILEEEISQNQKYEDLTIERDTFTDNIDQLELFHYNDIYVGEQAENSMVLTSNAFYDTILDQLNVPLGISQKPFFDPGYPYLINLAKLGWIIGHEISHAFEYHMRSGSDDNYLPVFSENISNLTLINFKDRRSCMIGQYNGFEINSVHQDNYLFGRFTFDENWADVSGLQLAFATFMEYHRESFGPFPGLKEMSAEQLFFVASAQTSCRAFSAEEIKNETLVAEFNLGDPHSPFSVRVLGEMINFNEFSKAFNCPVGSRYNPVDKCLILA